MKALDGLEIGEKKVRVQRVSSDTTSALVEEQESENTKIQRKVDASNKGGSFLNNYYNIKDPLIRAMVTIPKSCVVPSRVVQFLNMCSVEDLFEDFYYQELFQDVK